MTVELPDFTVLLTLILGSFTVIVALFQLIYRRRDFEISRYNEARKEAELSAMRASYERHLSELTREMVATKARWEDVNHLLVSGQKHQSEALANEAINPTAFLLSFGIQPEQIELQRKQIFVLTPFADEEAKAFETVRRVCSNAGLRAIRGDETRAEGDILQQVMQGIVSSRLIVANISSRNPNVFFELGIAMALGKPTLLISDTLSEMPFDVRARRILIYKNYVDLQNKLSEALLQTLAGDPFA